ncbi:hypothetical protein STEG23_030130, partial [Scotinomys teguina]
MDLKESREESQQTRYPGKREQRNTGVVLELSDITSHMDCKDIYRPFRQNTKEYFSVPVELSPKWITYYDTNLVSK